MGSLVCSGAPIQCSFGTAVSNLNVTSQSSVFSSKPIACIMDNAGMTNIPPFGMCQSMANPAVSSATTAAMGVLTPQPCTPMITAPWGPAASSVIIGTSPAMLDNSQLSCSYGGMIQLTSPGETNLMAN